MSTSPPWQDSAVAAQDAPLRASVHERAARLGWAIALVGLAALAALAAPLEARPPDRMGESVAIPAPVQTAEPVESAATPVATWSTERR